MGQKGFIPLIILFATLAVGGGGAATVKASQSSLPGQPLYSIKELTEQARVAIALTPEAKSRVYLDIANTKLQEAEQMQSSGGSGEVIAQALEKFQQYQEKAVNVLGKSESETKQKA